MKKQNALTRRLILSKPTIPELINSQQELEPETLQELYPNLDSKERQRILALRLLRHHRGPYEDFDVFENVCLAVNDIEPTVEQREGCNPRHIWYTLEVIKRLFDGELPPLSDEVVIYIRGIHRDFGFRFYPPGIGLNEDDQLEEIKQKANKGPFPLGEDPQDIQAARYLKIQQYLESKKT